MSGYSQSLSQCTYRCVVLPDEEIMRFFLRLFAESQCTYRCVVLPDLTLGALHSVFGAVSMHLQVRGAP